MGLGSALYTGLSGLNANAQTINVAGNNIANSNTTAFKSGRTDFETQINQTLRLGSAPSDSLGGTNPVQVGLGVRLGNIATDFSSGSVQPTGVATDVAIDGAGFFVVDDGEQVKYTRNGAFTLDNNSNLVTASGARVQGYGVDADFNLIEGPLQDVTIPLGSMTVAQATEEIKFAGNLNADGELATAGAVQESDPIYADATQTAVATGATALASLFDDTGTQLFSSGDIITVTGVGKGSSVLPDRTFEVGAVNTSGADAFGTTFNDLITFFEGVFGIDSTLGTAGVSINGSGQVVIESNLGTRNAIDVGSAEIVVDLGGNPSVPFSFSNVQEATGESVKTSMVAYDSLGSELLIDLTVSLVDRSNTGTTWQFIAESGDDSDVSRVLGSGTIEFDNNGQFLGTTNNTVSIDRNATGAFSPQSIQLTFGDPGLRLNALADTTSEIAAAFQDGFGIGTLVDFSFSDDGTIQGVYSNSQLRTLGQLVLADFVNPSGLQQVAGSQYSVTAASGSPMIAAGKVVGQALELSNVDLSNEFINLINASTGYSANSRVVTTSDQLLQELLQQI